MIQCIFHLHHTQAYLLNYYISWWGESLTKFMNLGQTIKLKPLIKYYTSTSIKLITMHLQHVSTTSASWAFFQTFFHSNGESENRQTLMTSNWSYLIYSTSRCPALYSNKHVIYYELQVTSKSISLQIIPKWTRSHLTYFQPWLYQRDLTVPVTDSWLQTVNLS